MKKTFKLITATLVVLFFLPTQTAEAQLLKRLKRKIEHKVEQKVEREVDKEIDDVLEGGDKKDKKEEETKSSEEKKTETKKKKDNQNTSTVDAPEKEKLEVYSKFDYVPGDKLIFFDDFSNDFVGDFPSRWNTNGTGEVVKFNTVEGNWLELKTGYNIYFIPDIKNLPQDYTIEFDIMVDGIDNQTSSTAKMFLYLSDIDKFNRGNDHYARVSIPFGQYSEFPFSIRNHFNKSPGKISSSIEADIRKEILNKPHISISVTQKRLRLWVNEKKYIDIPRLIEELDVLNFLKFHLYGFTDGKERVFISNLKVAEGGVDLRRKLMSEGKVSTNGILFDSGSANIKPQSYGIIRQISQVLMQDSNIKLNIIGHTDADGDDESNLKLSKQRADAVRDALINVYKVDSSRLQTDGKGESVPVGDNTTVDGKAQNRRVEFVKI